ncbi:Ldh family oxidoreductase [Thermoanaerobacterium sp. DL9XJH110]|uniref:Ldh family oxidoreductase n=1 Tax=Thermoanaerobacterium sp. DL9XJH110 TaxID=3386643 RepID=UPI003BB7BB68
MSSQPINVSRIQDFCTSIFLKAGLSQHNSRIIAESLLCAELRGVKSHGIVRIPTYLQRLETGAINVQARMRVEKRQKAAALLNADNGFGQVAGYNAMRLAISLAENYGVGLVGVRQSNHFGIASYYSMLALEKDMIGIVLTNSSPAIAPYGTSKPLLGTNPLSVAIPAENEKPIVLDMSTSVVARGKIRFAQLKKEKIPLGWALDSEGNDTEDPEKALKGSLLPIGGVKGSGLSLVIDILCGVLTDSCLTGQVKNVTDMSGPSKTGHMFCALNISSFIDVNLFKSNIDLIIKKIKSLPAVNNTQVFLPGEIEYNLTSKAKEVGIQVESTVIESLNSIARRYGISELH